MHSIELWTQHPSKKRGSQGYMLRSVIFLVYQSAWKIMATTKHWYCLIKNHLIQIKLRSKLGFWATWAMLLISLRNKWDRAIQIRIGCTHLHVIYTLSIVHLKLAPSQSLQTELKFPWSNPVNIIRTSKGEAIDKGHANGDHPNPSWIFKAANWTHKGLL